MTDPSTDFIRSQEYHLVFSELISTAQRRGHITYQEIAKVLGLPLSGNYMGMEISKIAGRISSDEHMAGRPMLTSILVNVRGIPGPGYFDLARFLKRLDSSDADDEKEFWEAEKQAVYKEWKINLRK